MQTNNQPTCRRCGKQIDRTHEGQWIDTNGYVECDGWGAPHETSDEHRDRVRSDR